LNFRNNPYEILGVSRYATSEDINRAYKKLMKKYHPDLARPEDRSEREEKCKEINEAKDILLNEDLRRQYEVYRRRSQPSSEQRRPSSSEWFPDVARGGGFFSAEELLIGDFFQGFLSDFMRSRFEGSTDFFRDSYSHNFRIRPGELFEIKLPNSSVNAGIRYLNNLFEYYNVELLEYELREGTKYHTVLCWLRGNPNNLERMRKTIREKDIKIVRKKVAKS